ncbi:MAG: RNB domain-containing ribonuclease [Nakamurella sp.]
MRNPPIRADQAAIDFATIRDELGIAHGFADDVHVEARTAAQQVNSTETASYLESLPHVNPQVKPVDGKRTDDRDIPLVTIDPTGSNDLDQAVHIAEIAGGFRVHYAIADVAAFVAPGGAIDAESRRRGMTLYCPDIRVPLYPTELCEGAASLLPDADRLAVLWTIDIDDRGEPTAVDVRRSLVRSRAQLDYVTVQAQTNVGELHPSIALLPRVGRLRLQAARRRHAIDLDLPDSEVVCGDDGRWTLRRREILPVEQYNAQISLLTGMCAAHIMLAGKVGILRTLPPPDHTQIAQLRRATAALGIAWPEGVPPGDIVSELDATQPRHAAFIEDAIRLLRGAGYTAFDGELPEQRMHGGLGAPYAHVTAPLRRLVDRFATEVCLALHAHEAVPAWVRGAFDTLPREMDAATRLSREVDTACTRAVSEFLLAGHVGEVLTGMVVQVEGAKGRATMLLDEPAVRVRTEADGLVEGTRAAIRLVAVDKKAHRVDVELMK